MQKFNVCQRYFKKGSCWIVNSESNISFWDENWVFPYPILFICTLVVEWNILRYVGLLMSINNGIRLYWRMQSLMMFVRLFLVFFFRLHLRMIILFGAYSKWRVFYEIWRFVGARFSNFPSRKFFIWLWKFPIPPKIK